MTTVALDNVLVEKADGIATITMNRPGRLNALGLPLAEEPPALPCAKVEGRECRRVLRVGAPKKA